MAHSRHPRWVGVDGQHRLFAARTAPRRRGSVLCGAVAVACTAGLAIPGSCPGGVTRPGAAAQPPAQAAAPSWCSHPIPSATAQGRRRHRWAVRPRRRSFRRTCPGDRGVPPCTSVASAMRLPPGLGSSPSRPVFPAGYGHLPLLAYRRHTRSTAALTAIVRLGVGHLRGAPPDRAPPGSDSELP